MLLDDIEPAVRLWAASHALDIAPDRAVPVLRALAGEQAAAALHQAGLGAYAELIAPRTEPSIKLRPTRCAQAEIAIGASRFGGLPDLPPGFRWPMFHDTPLVFLAQLDLARLPRVASTRLPCAGWLVFIYDMESWGTDPADRGSASVAYFEAAPTELVRCAPPGPHESLVSGADIFAPCRLSFAEVVDMPIQDDMRRECQLAVSSMSDDPDGAGKRQGSSANIHAYVAPRSDPLQGGTVDAQGLQHRAGGP